MRDTDDLNPPWAVAYRRLNQWARRQFFRLDTPIRRRLLRRLSILSMLPSHDAGADLAELGRINWILGQGRIHRFTPAQLAEQEVLAEQICKELQDEGK